MIVSYVGYQPQRQEGVVINSNKITFLDIQLTSGIELTEFEVVQYTVPLIDKDGGASGGTVTREDIARMPGRSAASIATTVGGTSDAGTGGGISIRGARSENTYYYIDGVKVPAGAGTGLPKSAIEEVQVIAGGARQLRRCDRWPGEHHHPGSQPDLLRWCGLPDLGLQGR
ncbi:MAG: TonB-dependent receptor plug domain-containing protein [Flavobacteriales bacterium]